MVQIVFFVFSHKVKYHRGRGPASPIWVFGMVDTQYSPAIGYMEIVPSRDAATLLPIIARIVRPGSIIHSDQWRAYANIQRDLGFIHRTVNHSRHFVDPQTGVHTQAIESYWNRQKQRFKRMNGCQRKNLGSYLTQFMWLERNRAATFENFCKIISEKYNFI